MSNEALTEIAIETEADIVLVRRITREAAQRAGFGPTDVTRLVTACSEMARNIFKYAGKGKMHCLSIEDGSRTGLQLVFQDQGPGIADIGLAMQEGYTTSGGLGMGLPGTRRLVDEFEIRSVVGQGTMITLKKWRRRIP
jgi:serine/threonine-protein kinase RsbT